MDAAEIKKGQRLRAKRNVELSVMHAVGAPRSETSGGVAQIPAGTVLVALGGAPGAAAINVYPEAHEALEASIVKDRAADYRGYGLVIHMENLGRDFELCP
jgi:hypothetical protein